MNYKAVEVCNYRFTDSDQLFFDTNIWFYIFGPQEPKYQRNRWMRIYSGAFKHILKAKSDIYIDILVVSEFINRYARLKYDVDAPPNVKFKDFRNSSDFKPVAKGIAADVKRVLKHCKRVESGFKALDMDDLLNDHAAGNFDFNDQVITEICKNNGFTLVTNDSDFKTQRIPILTANQSLLGN